MSDDLVEIARGSHNGDTYIDGTMKEPRLLIHVLADEIARLRAALATARREGMEEAAKIAAEFETVAYQHGNLPYMDPHECAAQTAREIAASIRAAAQEGNP